MEIFFVSYDQVTEFGLSSALARDLGYVEYGDTAL